MVPIVFIVFKAGTVHGVTVYHTLLGKYLTQVNITDMTGERRLPHWGLEVGTWEHGSRPTEIS